MLIGLCLEVSVSPGRWSVESLPPMPDDAPPDASAFMMPDESAVSEPGIPCHWNATGTGVLEAMSLADQAFDVTGVSVKSRMSKRAFLAALSLAHDSDAR